MGGARPSVTSAAPKLGVLIPSYQSADTVVDVAREVLPFASVVLVVDDGSTDDTAHRLESAGLTFVSHDVNRGKGAALRTGMEFLFRGDVDHVITLDADGQHLPSQIPVMAARLVERPDIVLGSREHLFQGMCRLRRWSNRLSSAWISSMAGAQLRDAQTGYRAYSRRFHEEVSWSEDGFEAESALLVRAARAGLSIVSQPIDLGFVDGRATSHYRPLMDSLQIGRAVLRARLAETHA